jgi:hypothetical protein
LLTEVVTGGEVVVCSGLTLDADAVCAKGFTATVEFNSTFVSMLATGTIVD